MTANDKYQVLREATLRCSSGNPPVTLGTDVGCVSAERLNELWDAGQVASKLPRRNSIYVHVPYCAERRCSFCMYRSSTSYTDETLRDYASKVHLMLGMFENHLHREISNVYVGGGTPTVYHPDELLSLLQPFSHLIFTPNGERTCEMSPTTATVDHVAALSSLRFNRISIGVQSFDRDVLAKVNRRYAEHSQISALVSKARELHFVDVNVDLMFGLPGVSESSIRRSVRAAVETGALSISIYNYRRRCPSTDLDERNRMEMVSQFRAAKDTLEALGWECYAGDETTEYHLFYSPERARNTVRYQTSSNGVENNAVFGLGAYANGFNPALSYECTSDGNEFVSGHSKYRCWVSSIDQQIRLGTINLLYARGNRIKKSYFEDVYGVKFSDYFKSEIADLVELGKATEDNEFFALRPVSRVDGIILQRFFLPIGSTDN